MHERADRSHILGKGALPQAGIDGFQLPLAGCQSVGLLQTFATGRDGFEVSDDGTGSLAGA
jgi:hypothetical protein